MPSEKNLLQKNLSQKNLSQKNFTEKNFTEKNFTEKNLSQKKLMMIIDGSSLLFRAFYALPMLTAPTGEPTNAIVGFSNMLMRLLTNYHVEYLAVAFDKSRQTFRTTLDKNYKGTRKPTPSEFSQQVPLLMEYLNAFGIPFLEIDNFEADDIIGTIAKKMSSDENKNSFEIFIVTGDRDAFQLIDDEKNIRVLYTKKGITNLEIFDEKLFREQFGFAPKSLIDFKALAGDESDNISGVPKIGKKRATDLIQKFGTIENLFDEKNLSDMTANMRQVLLDGKEQAFLSKKLATIVCDVPLPFEICAEKFLMQPKRNEFLQFCQRYDLRMVQRGFEKLFPSNEQPDLFSLEETLAPENNAAQNQNDLTNHAKKIFSLKTKDDAENFFKEFFKNGEKNFLSFMANYSGKVPHKKILQIGLALNDGLALCDIEKNADAWQIIRTWLCDETLQKITIDVKSFFHVIRRDDLKNIDDLSVMEYLLRTDTNEAAKQPQEIFVRMCSTRLANEEHFEFGNDFEKYDLAQQASVLKKLFDCFCQEIKKFSLEKVYETIEKPLTIVLAKMENRGIYLNRQQLEIQKKNVGQKILALEEEIYKEAGHEFNIKSPQQLAIVLFEELKLPATKKNQRGYSTNAEVLESLRGTHDIIEKILTYRLWTKLKSTYLDSLDLLIDEKTNRIHTNFHQIVTATGRLSSSDPNLQNIPVRTTQGRDIRQLFEPSVQDGYDLLLSADYSQIELRLLAHLSQDENFLKAFQNNEDVHARTASEVFEVALEDVTPSLRSKAKAVNFGIVYGISDYGLARDLNISTKLAHEYIQKFFTKYSGVKNYLDGLVKFAHENNFVQTMFGRRRTLPAINSKKFFERSFSERMAMNSPIQGSAADIVKLAMIDCEKKLCEKNLKSRILLQVHDELVLEIKKEELDEVKILLRDVMEHVVVLRVPIPIDIHVGKHWNLK